MDDGASRRECVGTSNWVQDASGRQVVEIPRMEDARMDGRA